MKVCDLWHVLEQTSEVFPDHLDHDFIDHSCTTLDSQPNNERRRQPTNAKTRLYNSWKMLLPDLLDPLIVYLSSSKGRLVPSVTGDIAQSCTDPKHDTKTFKILCLYFNREDLSFSMARCSRRPYQTFAPLTSPAVNVSPSHSS